MILALCTTPWVARMANASTPVILVFGDSLSAEYGLPRGTGWAALLAERLKQKRIDYSVANASISGETTSGGAARIDAALKTHKPAIAIIELGGNDGLRGLSLDATRANMTRMIEAAQRSGAKGLVTGHAIATQLWARLYRRLSQTVLRSREDPQNRVGHRSFSKALQRTASRSRLMASTPPPRRSRASSTTPGRHWPRCWYRRSRQRRLHGRPPSNSARQ